MDPPFRIRQVELPTHQTFSPKFTILRARAPAAAKNCIFSVKALGYDNLVMTCHYHNRFVWLLYLVSACENYFRISAWIWYHNSVLKLLKKNKYSHLSKFMHCVTQFWKDNGDTFWIRISAFVFIYSITHEYNIDTKRTWLQCQTSRSCDWHRRF